MAKALDSSLEVSEFKLLSRYYVHFRTNTLEKGITFLIPLTQTMFFYKNGFGIK